MGLGNVILGITVTMLLFETSCNGVSLYRRIVGGQPMTPGQDPWLVSLWYMPDNVFTHNSGLHHLCGAAIIAPNFLLTAAQCFDNRVIQGLANVSNWKVVGGLYNQNQTTATTQFRTIKKVYMNPNWDIAKILGDAAVVELTQPFDMSEPDVGVISYQAPPGCVKAGKVCSVAGWGQLAEQPYGNGSILPRTLNTAIVDTKTCKAAMVPKNTNGFTYVIDSSVLCVGGTDGKSACYGDAGEPLVCTCNGQKVIGGIVSYGPGCGRPGLYVIYTNVPPIAAWIKSIVG